MLGETISHYKILEKLGQGGMGEVYLAEDLRLGRRVALKFLAPELADDRGSRVRFRNEAKAAAELSHPNIATIYDVGEVEGKPFLALEYVEGQTLLQRVQEGPLPMEDVLRIGVDLAKGLAEAHANGIVHRDIKSSNVVVTDRGETKILDFGLAHRSEATRITRSGTTMGTIAYMSPEQARGDDVDERSDIWSLGVVLYECATGRLPFGSDRDAAILQRILGTTPDPASRHRKELPAGLDSVLETSLTKSLDQRYARVSDLLSDLLDLQAGQKPPVRRAHRRPSRRWAYGAIATAGLVAVAYWIWPFARTSVQQGEPVEREISRSAIAVLPFAVRGGNDESGLGDGLVDLLSSKLDGAGTVRSVDPRALLTYVRQQEGDSSDLMFNLETARHFDAGLCIVGDVFQGDEHININAALYATDQFDTPLTTTSVQGEVSSILALVDQLATQLLKEHFVQGDGTTADLESVTTSSFPALKAYLVGESAYRESIHGDTSNRERAKEAYLQAVDRDSTFALAWYRLAQIEASGYAVSQDAARVATANALAHRDKLSQHDLLHVRGLKAEIDDDLEEAEQIYQTLLGLSPDCLDAIVSLSKLRHWQAWRRGQPITRSQPLLERALALDPDNRDCAFRLAWVHVVDGDWDEAETWFRRAYASEELPVADRVSIGYGMDDPSIEDASVEMLAPLSLGAKINATLHVSVFTDDLDGAAKLAGMFTVGEHSDEMRALGHLILAHLEVASGRWEDAKVELEEVAKFRSDLAIESKALLAAQPFLKVSQEERQAIRAELAAWNAEATKPSTIRYPWIASHDGYHQLFKTYLTGVLDIGLGQFEEGLAAASELEAAVSAPPDTTLGFDLAQALRGMAAMGQGKREQALEEFSKARFQVSFDKQIGSLIHFRSLERYLRAELLSEMGRLEEAGSWFESLAWSLSFEYIYRAPAQLELARISERLADTEKAVEHYSRFAGFWNRCDPELRPLVREAETRIQKLSREGPVSADKI